MKTVKRMSAIFLSLLLLISFSTITAEASSLPKTSITSITAYPCGFKAYFNKQTKITGYQIQYSTSKKFTKKTTKTKTTKKTSYKVKNLKEKTTYYVRVRSYKLDANGKKVYSKWTTVKKTTTKQN